MSRQVELIKAEIEKRIKEGEDVTRGTPSSALFGLIQAYKNVITFINSLPEEPASKDLEEASKEWLRPQLDKSYANYGEVKMMELTHFDGYAMLDAIEFGAKWQKEQMMKDAFDAELDDVCGFLTISVPYHNGIVGDKVKVIIIKSE